MISTRAVTNCSNCTISWEASTLTLSRASLVLTAEYVIPLTKIHLFCNSHAISYTFLLSLTIIGNIADTV